MVVWTLNQGAKVDRSFKSFWDDLKRGRDFYLMLLPFALLFTLFVVIPVGSSIVLSFTYFNVVQTPRFNGLENYIRMFLDDSVFLIAVKNTLIFAMVTGPISYFACLFFAWLVNELSPKLRALITIFLYIPSMSSSLFVVWIYIFSGDQYGYINGVLMNMGFLAEPIQWLADKKYIFGVAMFVQLWLSLGTSFLAFIAGLQGVDRQLYEASAIDGVKNRLQELWYVTLPSMGPQLMFGAIIQIGAAFAAGNVVTQLLGSQAGVVSTDYAATTLVTHMADVGTSRFEMGYASAIGVFLFAAMWLFSLAIRRILRKFTD